MGAKSHIQKARTTSRGMKGWTLKRLSVGKDTQDAATQRLRKESELNAVNNGVAIADEAWTPKRRLIASAVAEYLDEIKITRSIATHSAYELALRNFTESCPTLHLEDITFQALWSVANLSLLPS